MSQRRTLPTPPDSCEPACDPATGPVPRLTDDLALDAAEVFGVLADSTRLKIIAALMGGELCVCEIADGLGLRQSTVSHQLRLLRNLRLVSFRKQGRTVYYRLCDEHVATLLRQTLDHLSETRTTPIGKTSDRASADAPTPAARARATAGSRA